MVKLKRTMKVEKNHMHWTNSFKYQFTRILRIRLITEIPPNYSLISTITIT